MSYFFHFRPLVALVEQTLHADKISYPALAEQIGLNNSTLYSFVKGPSQAIPVHVVLKIANFFRIELYSLVTTGPEVEPSMIDGRVDFRLEHFRKEVADRLEDFKGQLVKQTPLFAAGVSYFTISRILVLPFESMTLRTLLGASILTNHHPREFFAPAGPAVLVEIHSERLAVPEPVIEQTKPNSFKETKKIVIDRLREVFPPTATTLYEASIVANLTFEDIPSVVFIGRVRDGLVQDGCRFNKEFAGRTTAQALAAFEQYIEELFFPTLDE